LQNPVSPRGLRWAAVLLPGGAIALSSPPEGITASSWFLFAIFVSTIAGLIVRPLPGGAMVLLGVTTTAATGLLTPNQALAGYADPIVWLVLAAFFMSRGMIKTGLGRRIAFWFIGAIGHRSLGLGYALASTDLLLASYIPSNAARSGGIVFPIAKSLAEAYDSHPGRSAGRLGAFLMPFLYQCDVIACSMFLTGQASNALIARFVQQVTQLELSYARWALGALVPGLAAFAITPLILYWLSPPEVRRTPDAARIARAELARMGPMDRGEKLMLGVFGLVALLWMTIGLRLPGMAAPIHNVHYAVVALIGVAVLLLSGVLEWSDLTAERSAWDVFLWYGGLVQLAQALGETGITKQFADAAGGWTGGWSWLPALLVLVLVYYYAHYAFASITAHATAMFIPFLVVLLAAGAPVWVAVLTLAYGSNLMASVTHYGTTPGPIYFGAGYVSQTTWWRLGFVASVVNLVTMLTVGLAWWKVLGWW
jgi:divalent anion:Na+ symporter, DASS family